MKHEVCEYSYVASTTHHESFGSAPVGQHPPLPVSTCDPEGPATFLVACLGLSTRCPTGATRLRPSGSAALNVSLDRTRPLWSKKPFEERTAPVQSPRTLMELSRFHLRWKSSRCPQERTCGRNAE
ncbi:hypothetical protein VFPBJ_03163 [Purpureocillium lilacinum]|uniref:Uncharacterized protein n=1 Tax=Purpureocillium lilacinum TaxID=33203 RepID=A0A179H2C4_PURLI|nr:hypothetical protein VFPBJ_03163 [Purpureocillium lilacinum]